MADPLPDPEALALDPTQSSVDFTRSVRAAGTVSAIQGLDEDGEAATRALELGRGTGDNPTLIYGDLEHYEKQKKAQLVHDILQNNPTLIDYASSHPLAPVVSQNDWAQLDSVHQALTPFGRGATSVLDKVLKAAKEHFSLDNAFAPVPQPPDSLANNRLLYNIWNAAFQPGSPLFAARFVGALPEAFTAGLAGAQAGITEAQVQMGMDPQASEQRSRELTAMIEAQAMRTSGAPHLPTIPPEIVKAAKRLAIEFPKLEPYLAAGKEPPAHLSDLVDEARKWQAKLDAKNLKEAESESNKSETREIAPELFEKNFVAPLTENARIGLDADAVLKLYGDKRPEVDDNLLGWVPGIAEQFDRAVATGADIEVPIEKWLAHADPELQKELKDFVRVRAGGMTLEEAKEPKKEKPEVEAAEAEAPPEEEAPPVVEAIREAAGFHKVWEAKPGDIPDVVPESAQLGTHVEGEKSYPTVQFDAKDVLARVNPESLTGVAKTLTSFFKGKIAELAGDTPVKVLAAKDMEEIQGKRGLRVGGAGFYDPITHEIMIHEGVLSRPGGAAHVLIHEGAHAMTTRAISRYPELKATIRKMMEETGAFLRDTDSNSYSKHSYAFKNEHEFIAEAFSNGHFQEVLASSPISEALAKELKLEGKDRTAWGVVKKVVSDLIEKLIGIRPTDSIMDGILKLGPVFEEAQKRGFEDVEFVKRARPLEAPPDLPENLRGAFKNAAALKMTTARLEGYLKAVAEQQARDLKFSKDQETLRAAASATKEWKDNLPRVREEARKDTLSRPDIAIDRFLREGLLPDGSKGPKVKLGETYIDKEILGRLPPGLTAKLGVAPDSLASRFGFDTGRELVDALAKLEDQRKVEGSTPAAHLSQTIEAEAQRRMEKDYGRSAQDILDDAEAHVFNPTTHDILHHELAALYEGAGQQPITKDALKRHAKMLFDKLPIGTHSSLKYMGEMSRQRELALDHLLEGNPTESLKAQEKAALLAYHADFALKQEKLRKQFDRKVETSWSRRDPPGLRGEDAVWLHDIMERVGLPVKRIGGDLEWQKVNLSTFTNIRDYVVDANRVRGTAVSLDPSVDLPGQLMPVAELFLDPTRNLPSVNEMTPPEFKMLFDSLKAIDFYSRYEKTYNTKEGRKALEDVIGGLNTRMKDAVADKTVSEGRIASAARTFGSLILNPESWMLRLDLGNALGPFSQLVIKPIMEGQYELKDFEKQYAKLWRGLPDIGRREKIKNGLFKDPRTGDFMELDSHNLRAIIQNMGNEVQRKKLAAGYGIDDPNKIWDWLFNVQGITKDHIKFAQHLGTEIFGEAFKLVEAADSRRLGFAPARIELGKIQTPWGEEDEWYHPLIRDPLRSEYKVQNLMEESGYYRPSPSAGFKKERVPGANYPIDLTFDQVPFKLKQILNYAAMSEPVADVSKIVYHPQFQMRFKQHYGPEYYSGMQKWLKDVAGNQEWIPSNEKAAYEAARIIQENMSGALIGLNLGTVIKHGLTAGVFSAREVGLINFARTGIRMIKEAPGSQEAWAETMDKSAEVRNRFRDFRDSITGTNEELFKKFDKDYKLFKVRDAIQWIGHYPVAMSDLFSAVPMWHAKYTESLKTGMTEGDAVYSADTAVRRTHGSTIVGAKSQLLRINNPIVRSFMTFYNFFNNAVQRNYEYAWKSKLAITGRELPEMTGHEKEQFQRGFKNLPNILGGILTFGPMVGIFEQLVDPLPQGEEESNIWHWGKVLTRPYGTMIPLLRDLINYKMGGHDPSVGLYGTMARKVGDLFDEKTWSGEHPEKTLRKINSAFGMMTGLSNEEVGKLLQYLASDEDKPADISDVYKIYRHGTLKERK